MMTPRRRQQQSQENARPAVPVGEKHTREATIRDSEISAHAAVLAVHAAHESDEACRAALAAFTAPEGWAHPVALLFVCNNDEDVLQGYAGMEMPSEGETAPPRLRRSLNQALRAVRIPLDLGAEHPLVKAVRARQVRLVPSEEVVLPADLMRALPDPPGQLALVPARGLDGPLGVFVLGMPADRAGLREDERPSVELLAKHFGLAMDRLRTADTQAGRTVAHAAIQVCVKTMLAATSLPDILLLVARTAAQATAASRVMVWTYTERSHELSLAAQYVGHPSDALDAVLPRFHYLAQLCVKQGGALLYPDLREEPEVHLESLPQRLSASIVPITAFGEIVGVMAAIDRQPAPAEGRDVFKQEDEDALGFLAGVCAVTINNARLTDRLRSGETRLREAQRMLVDTERMASLGELSARLMQELRSPLSAIAGFARRLEKGLPEGDPSREDAAIVAREAHRLEELLTQHSELARPTMPKLSPQALNQIIHEAVVLLRDELAGHGIFLEEAYGDQIPDLLLDADRIRRVVLSTLRNAMDSLRDGDTIRIETLREGDRVLLEIARTGEQLPGEILERLFAPFSTPRPSGVGLALAVAQQIVKEHGGEISVRTEDEWGAIFTISFPIRANQERRKTRDRRSGRDRRRGRKKR